MIHQQEVQLILEAQTKSAVMDFHDSVDLYAGDIVRFVLPKAEPREQEIVTSVKPEEQRMTMRFRRGSRQPE